MVLSDAPNIPSSRAKSRDPVEVTFRLAERGCFASLRMTCSKISLQDQASAQNSFRSHDLAKFLEIFLHRFADDGVTVIAPMLHLARGRFQTRFDLRRRFSPAFGQTSAQFLEIRRHDKNISQRFVHETVATIANGSRTLGIDVDQNVNALFQIVDQRLPQRAVIMFMHFGVFQKFARFYSRQKICFGKKAIIFAVDLAGAGRPSSAGNGVNEIGRLPKSITQGGFTRARWSGDDEQDSTA